MVPAFESAFAACQSNGLSVPVTTSHSAPYQTDSPQVAVDLVKSWVSDANINVLSPQLYSSGYETSPQFDETYNCKSAGCTWNLYQNSVAAFVPSIVAENQYSSTQSWFSANYGITCDGFIQWSQSV